MHRVPTWLTCFILVAALPAHGAPSPTPKPPAPASRPTPPPPVPLATPAGGIAQAADQLAAQALDLLNAGKLDEAAAMYATLLKQFPTAGAVPEALFRTGYIDFVQGKYDLAVTTLRKVTTPPATPDVKTAADALIPQVLAAQAGKLPQDDPRRKAGYKAALDQFDAFVKQYPNSDDVETARYGRAVAAFQGGEMDEAIKTLEGNITQFPNSGTLLDSVDLLAIVLMARANETLERNGDAKSAMFDLDRATKLLAEIIRRRTDIVLANDAQFQVGEVLFARGNKSGGAARAGAIVHAIDAYRAVHPKDEMLKAQEARIAELQQRRTQLVANRNIDGLKELQRLTDRENAKLESMKQAPDQTLNAQLRIAACFFLLQRYDEARVLVRFLQGFADDDGAKKQLSYYLVLTYASQGLADKAVQAYEDFMAKYKGDPIGESLPLAVGAAYLNPRNNAPDKAIKYLQDEIRLYPKSKLVNDALGQQANALLGLQRYAEALDTYKKYLSTNPDKEQAAAAEVGIANIYQITNKIPDAIRQFQKVASSYPGTPQAEQAGFYAAGLALQVDPKQALSALREFVSKYPDGKFSAQATLMIGQVQAATGQVDAAMQTYKEVIAKFPKTDYGPAAYFAQASILGSQKKTGDMVKLLQDFIKAYPDYKDVFAAYDTIGQVQAEKKEYDAAVDTYNGMVADHPDDPKAPLGLVRIAELWRKRIDTLGRYLALDEDQRKTWNSYLTSSLDAGEQVLDKYGDSDQAGLVLTTILDDQKLLVTSGQKKPEDVEKYFQGLAAKAGSRPAAKNRVLLALATYNYEKNPAKAFGEMQASYDPSLVYAPSQLDVYGEALIDQGKAADAYKLYAKIGADFPIPPGAQPSQATNFIQEAQAISLFGMGSALAKQGKTADAGKLFSQLKQLYPWSPKVIEANFGIARNLVAQKKYDDALHLLTPLVSNRGVPSALRGKATVLLGDVYMGKDNLAAAIDSYLKAAEFFSGIPEVAAEASWKGAQALERQADTLNETTTPKRSAQLTKARNAYQEIISNFPNSQWVKQAGDRLAALPAK